MKWLRKLWHFHTWGKWEEYSKGDLANMNNAIIGIQIVQKRTCSECQYTQYKSRRVMVYD